MRSTVVLDANAFVRAAERHQEASAWVERIDSRAVQARAPDLVYAEVANAVLGQARAGLVDLHSALAIVDALRRLPIQVTTLRDLAVPAFRLTERCALSVYDACYVVLAEEAQATLVTADRRVAAAAAESIFLA